MDELHSTFGFEDWATQRDALQLSAGDRVCCVTGSGDGALHLLMNEDVDVVSVDHRPHSDHLLKLKCAAMRELPFDDYLAFLGASPGEDRDDILGQLLLHMGVETSLFWDQHRSAIDRGILFEGVLERWTARLRGLLPETQRQLVERLFDCQTLDEQAEFLAQEWDDALFCATFEQLLHPLVGGRVMNESGRHIYLRLRRGLDRSLARTNPFLMLMFTGRIEEQYLPPHLRRDAIWRIRSHLKRLTSHTADIADYLLESPAGSFDAFSVSSVPSYLPDPQFERMLEGMAHAARPGARFCIRQLLSHRTIPTRLEARLCRDSELEQRLEEQDRCFVHSFLAGRVEAAL